jgi:hypothetical protein
MNILAHRGLWDRPEERNTIASFKRAVKEGFGFESDVRDYLGNLVISHDIAGAEAPLFETALNTIDGTELTFAVNIKADGLFPLLKAILPRRVRSFAFDMSIPQTLVCRELGIRFFTRQSEYESSPCLYEDAAGVWLDAFVDDSWLTGEVIRHHLENGKEVVVVSPELHGREASTFWERLRDTGLVGHTNMFLCTDLPRQAQAFFS